MKTMPLRRRTGPIGQKDTLTPPSNQEDQAVVAVQGTEAVERVRVDLDVVGPQGEARQPVDGAEGQFALDGHHLVQRAAGLPLDVQPGPALFGRQPAELLPEIGARQDFRHDPVGITVGTAGRGSGGEVEVGHAQQSRRSGRQPCSWTP
jgi:hypothetical protein